MKQCTHVYECNKKIIRPAQKTCIGPKTEANYRPVTLLASDWERPFGFAGFPPPPPPPHLDPIRRPPPAGDQPGRHSRLPSICSVCVPPESIRAADLLESPIQAVARWHRSTAAAIRAHRCLQASAKPGSSAILVISSSTPFGLPHSLHCTVHPNNIFFSFWDNKITRLYFFFGFQ